MYTDKKYGSEFWMTVNLFWLACQYGLWIVFRWKNGFVKQSRFSTVEQQKY